MGAFIQQISIYLFFAQYSMALDGWVDEWICGWMGGWMDGWMDGGVFDC